MDMKIFVVSLSNCDRRMRIQMRLYANISQDVTGDRITYPENKGVFLLKSPFLLIWLCLKLLKVIK